MKAVDVHCTRGGVGVEIVGVDGGRAAVTDVGG